MLSRSTPSVVLGPETSAPPGNFLERQSTKPTPHLLNHNSGVGLRNLSLNKFSRVFGCTPRPENHYRVALKQHKLFGCAVAWGGPFLEHFMFSWRLVLATQAKSLGYIKLDFH